MSVTRPRIAVVDYGAGNLVSIEQGLTASGAEVVIAPEPVQFTGFKIFYKNDMKPPSTRLLTPAEVLELTPAPSFIQCFCPIQSFV